MNHKHRTIARLLFCLFVVTTSVPSYLVGMDPNGPNDTPTNALVGVAGGTMLFMISSLCCIRRHNRRHWEEREARNRTLGHQIPVISVNMSAAVQDAKTEEKKTPFGQG